MKTAPFRTLTAVVALCSSAALAQTEAAAAPAANKPTPEQTQAFWSFYFKGAGQTPALGDAKLCLELVKDGDDKNECAKEVPAEGVKAGTVVQVWQAWVVPQKAKLDGVTVQVKLGDQIRETKDVTFKSESIRTRNWTSVRLSKAGTWTVEIKDGDQVVKSLQVKVN